MSGFSNVISGVQHWLHNLVHTATVKELIAVGSDVGKQVIVNAAMAGLSAHASGADKDATVKAIQDAATHTATTVGLTATTTEIENLVSHISDSIHTPEAPQPPA